MKKPLCAIALVLSAVASATAGTLVYAPHYCSPQLGEIDVDGDGITYTAFAAKTVEKFDMEIEFPEPQYPQMILTPRGQKGTKKPERIYWYYGDNWRLPVIFRDHVFWPMLNRYCVSETDTPPAASPK